MQKHGGKKMKKIKLYSDWGDCEGTFDTMEDAKAFILFRAGRLWEECKREIQELGRLRNYHAELTDFDRCLARVSNFYRYKGKRLSGF